MYDQFVRVTGSDSTTPIGGNEVYTWMTVESSLNENERLLWGLDRIAQDRYKAKLHLLGLDVLQNPYDECLNSARPSSPSSWLYPHLRGDGRIGGRGVGLIKDRPRERISPSGSQRGRS